MSQPPLSYASANIPVPSRRPTALTVLAIIGIVFGAMGVLCVGLSELFLLFTLVNPNLPPQFRAQPVEHRIINFVMGFGGLVLSAILLGGSIGSLNLKPVARRVMVGWAMADIIFDLLRLLVALLILLPATYRNPAFAQNPAFRNNPNAPQIQTFAVVGGVGGGVFSWAGNTTFAVLVYVFFRKPEFVAAFEGPPGNANPSLPIPPM